MRVQPRLIAIYSVPIILLLIPVFVFFMRAPVLVVTDMAFFELYGETRAKQESARASLSLYRPVRTVVIADDAGDDLVQFAIAEVSARPHCVLFPYRFNEAALLYRETFPAIPAVVLMGRSDANYEKLSAKDFFVYKTDIENDFLRAGKAALILDEVIKYDEDGNVVHKKGRIVVFNDSKLQKQAREAFEKVLDGIEEPPGIVYHTAFSQISASTDLSCVIIAGVGAEFLEKNEETPVIFFTWLAPQLLPFEVVIAINDAPWTQIVPSVRMVRAGMTEGLILSKMQIFSKYIDKKTLHKLRKIG